MREIGYLRECKVKVTQTWHSITFRIDERHGCTGIGLRDLINKVPIAARLVECEEDATGRMTLIFREEIKESE